MNLKQTFTGKKGAVPGQALAEVYSLLGLPLLRGLRPLGARLIHHHTVRIRSPARRRRRTNGGGRRGAHQRPWRKIVSRQIHEPQSKQQAQYPAIPPEEILPKRGTEHLTWTGRIGTRRVRWGEVVEEIVLGGDVDEGERLHLHGADRSRRRPVRGTLDRPSVGIEEEAKLWRDELESGETLEDGRRGLGGWV